jgi:hypothetical protein
VDGPARDVVTGIVRIVNRAAAAPRSPGADRRRWAGRYFSLWATLDVVPLGDEVLAVDPDAVDPMENVTELAVDGDGLRIAKTGGYGSPGEGVRLDADGSLHFGGQRFDPWDRFQREVMARFR